MENELRLHDELRIGDIVGDTKRMVIASTKIFDRVPGDTYATWVAICCKKGEYHPYVVWNVIARPEGFTAESGDYCSTLEQAVTMYKKRGGEA